MNLNEKDNQFPINENEDEEILSIPPNIGNNEDKKNNEKIICDFIIKEKLGEGTFGKVRLGINRQTEETVAIKILDKKKIIKERDKKRIEKELNILKSLRHPNIVHLYADIETNANIYIIMEYIKGIELIHYISSNSKLSEEEACFYFRQIISAIEYLHKLKIAHRDIKPENMIIENETKIIKLVDFGLSNYYNTKTEMLSSACGSPSYAAPEMLYGKKYSASPIDIWSCGIVLYAMICGYLPFDDPDYNILYKKIKEGKFKIPFHVSPNAKDLIKNLLVNNPKKRYTIEQIKKHTWFKLCLNNEDYRNKKSLFEGLLLNKYVIPLDEEIINYINDKYQIDKNEIIKCLLNDEHNDITTIYDLILLKNSKKGKESIADIKSNLFQKYLKDNKNLLINYNNDINKIIEKKILLINTNNSNKKEYEKNDEIDSNNINTDLNIVNNKNIENNEQDNNILYNHIDENKNLNNEKNEANKIIEKTQNSNEKKIKKENKVNSSDIFKKIMKFKINQTTENRNNSVFKRPNNLKIIKKKFGIKDNIQNNKSISKDKNKSISNNKNIKILNSKSTKEKKIIQIKQINPIIKKPIISNKEINKNKKNKTYKPNLIQNENNNNKTFNNQEDKKSKVIKLTKISNSGNKRTAKSVEKRKMNKNKCDIKPVSFGLKNINNKKSNVSIKSNKNNKKSLLTSGYSLSAETKK